jgi:hypothetical protein
VHVQRQNHVNAFAMDMIGGCTKDRDFSCNSRHFADFLELSKYEVETLICEEVFLDIYV